ncbi:MAG: amidase family protein [Proteobacteria bacterium]|nr:amidase family protein [Pseudomonadota bacterium]MDA1244758.1 amidase family protein [Pseudomonadota bacterium]
MNKGVTFDEVADTVVLKGISFRDCILALMLMLSLIVAATLSHAQSADYDEERDLAILASNENTRMHYQRLTSPLRSKTALWQGLESVIEAMPDDSDDYRRLETLVLEKSAAQLQSLVSQGTLSYEEITRFFIARIHTIETDDERYLNAIISLNPSAVDAARAADDERKAGKAVPPDSLFGLPILLKDNVGFEGLPTTAGAAALAANYTRDAFVTERLKANGVIILGKANLSEWAYFFCTGCPSGYSALGGQTLNPYGRLVFNTGGSSAGSGAAIAGGFAVAAVGSETSGSILSPSSANSLVGLKPTTGSLSRSGIVPISSTLDTVGPMARTVRDAVALFNAMTGYDQADIAMPRLTEDLKLLVRDADLSGVRLGFPVALASEPLIVAAIAKLEAAGAVIVPVEFAPPDLYEEVQFMGAEMVRDLAEYLKQYASNGVAIQTLGDLQAFNLDDPGERAPYGQALVDQMVGFESFFHSNVQAGAGEIARLKQLVVSEVGGYLDGLFSQHNLDALVRVNNSGASAGAFANYPALTIPAGYRKSGQPVGVTIYAPSFQEQRLIDIGLRLEASGATRQPPADY